MIGEWSTLIYNMFVQDIFGSKLLFGFGILLFTGFIAFKLRMNFTGFGVGLVAMIFLLSGMDLLPKWVTFIPVFIILLIIGLSSLRIGRR